jgi:predicted P-loop ATPase
MGDKFENISNSTIVNRSLLSNALNNISEQYGDEVKNALEELSQYIENSRNTKSAELLNGFNQELNNKEKNKTVLKTLWDGLVNSLPDAAKVTTAIATISKLFT